MSIQEIVSLLNEVRAENILLLCHQNADPDALCSASVFSKLLRRVIKGVNVKIASPEGVNKLSKVLLSRFSIEVEVSKPDFEAADAIFLLDTNTIQQLGEWSEEIKRTDKPIIVIDHHASHPVTESLADICISKEDSSSTCEIIFNFFRCLDLQPSLEEATLLFLGIAFDTKHFILANSETFKAVGYLVEIGVNPREALQLLTLPMDVSERIARLKAGQRLTLTRIKDWIIVFSHVGSYQASAARALIDLGAHVAIVSGKKGDQVQVSLRSSQEFYKKTGIHLGNDLARPLGEYMNGMGGGHSTSAGMDGVGDLDTVVKYSIKILKSKLKC